jgi:hypothetical protein
LVSSEAVQPDSSAADVCTATTMPVLGPPPLLLLLLPVLLGASCSHSVRCQNPYAPHHSALLGTNVARDGQKPRYSPATPSCATISCAMRRPFMGGAAAAAWRWRCCCRSAIALAPRALLLLLLLLLLLHGMQGCCTLLLCCWAAALRHSCRCCCCWCRAADGPALLPLRLPPVW